MEKIASLKEEERGRKQELKRCREELEGITRELNKEAPENLPSEDGLKREHVCGNFVVAACRC